MNKKNDQFADIAISGISTADKALIMPEPMPFKAKNLPLQKHSGNSFINFPKKMDSKEELYQELEIQKQKYKPYLRRLAPELEQYRAKVKINTFQWRQETKADEEDFLKVLQGEGQWETVTIPHFGGPLGKAKTYYRTTFELGKLPKNKSTFISFKGVDYKAHVFMNNYYLGSHEGFFAPFEFDFTSHMREGTNTLVVCVENDFIHKRNEPGYQEEMLGGDKIYAATGPGFDDPIMGWHHCPPGMGIYQEVSVEIRSRIFIKDIFVRPILEEDKIEAWIEIYQCDVKFEDIKLELSLYGRNFEATLFEKLIYTPVTGCEIGLGDSFTEAQLQSTGKINQPVHLYMEKGMNYLKVPISLKDYKKWTLNEPNLYEIQIKLLNIDEVVIDTAAQSFGMRSFSMDTENTPKGAMYLNGEMIRLRGANTMGHEQQCVMKEDFDQLINDILLAKICNMNFLRLTQRPVQEEIYDYCDMLGLMTQTDLPLFGVLRKNQFVEAVRQTEEMEKIVRKHPCNVMISYINEPFPNANNQPHRHLTRNELMSFFDAADLVVKLNNPDRVIKHVDGDYDPPSKTLPDNHCYAGWYNGSGIDIGALHKGYWIPVNADWYFGCGEYGAEGLDYAGIMRKYYPKEWLPQSEEEEAAWSPSRIIGSQTGNFHYFFFETPDTLQEWVKRGQEHQAWSTKFMTEAMRRNRRMVTSAIHLFIDAFPSGWMKTIMDVDRNPKPAYFAYQDALTPTMVSLRTDRFSYYAEEQGSIEVWICNDLPKELKGAKLHYEVLAENEQLFIGVEELHISACDVSYGGNITFNIPNMQGSMTVKAAIVDDKGNILHYNTLDLNIKKEVEISVNRKISILGNKGKGEVLLQDLNLPAIAISEINPGDLILVDDINIFQSQKKEIEQLVKNGTHLIFLEVECGEYELFDGKVAIKNSSMLPLHFASRNTGHSLVKGFDRKDFQHWYDASKDRITPILESTFIAEDMNPILTSGNTNKNGEWGSVLVAGEKSYGEGKVCICQVKLAGRTNENPSAKAFALQLLNI